MKRRKSSTSAVKKGCPGLKTKLREFWETPPKLAQLILIVVIQKMSYLTLGPPTIVTKGLTFQDPLPAVIHCTGHMLGPLIGDLPKVTTPASISDH